MRAELEGLADVDGVVGSVGEESMEKLMRLAVRVHRAAVTMAGKGQVVPYTFLKWVHVFDKLFRDKGKAVPIDCTSICCRLMFMICLNTCLKSRLLAPLSLWHGFSSNT